MKKISLAAFSRAENVAFQKDLPVKDVLLPDGGEMEIIDVCKVKELYPKRPINGHKGTFGRLLLIVGSDRFAGAAQISTLAALRSGVGIASVISSNEAARALNVSAKEAVVTRADSDENGFISASERNVGIIKDELKRATAVLIGCGLGNTPDTAKILETVILNANCPVIIDADGINALTSCIELLRTAKTEVILTPHPGELARLCGVGGEYAVENRCELAKTLSKEFGCTVVAKSSSTVIAGADGTYLSTFGNDGLARGGSGDLLAGLISSFAAQGLKPLNSAILGAAVMGLGCEMLTNDLSSRGVLPSDVIDALPLLFKKIERLE